MVVMARIQQTSDNITKAKQKHKEIKTKKKNQKKTTNNQKKRKINELHE
jgi:hypothetical protein